MSDPVLLELREHFATVEQQRRTADVGMWLFLVTEIMMFGGLFVAYTVYRFNHPQAFAEGSTGMNIVLGSINSAILLTSSLTMGFAELSAKLGRQRLLGILLSITILIGLAFLGIKFAEYYEHYQQHEAPGVWFNHTGPHAPAVQMFFVFYFIMTGLHAVHMIIGILLILGLISRNLIGSLSAAYHTPVSVVGLYWHFVDIVWIFLYAIFYLPGLHK
ncbi:MAG: cytochrome c oxidase subunit 3 [Bryobacteraceae bacterium]